MIGDVSEPTQRTCTRLTFIIHQNENSHLEQKWDGDRTTGPCDVRTSITATRTIDSGSDGHVDRLLGNSILDRGEPTAYSYSPRFLQYTLTFWIPQKKQRTTGTESQATCFSDIIIHSSYILSTLQQLSQRYASGRSQ